MNENIPASIVNLQAPILQSIRPNGWEQVDVEVLRLDAIHPVISGNKWYKLSGYLAAAAQHNMHHLITYGGPWSTHLLATAAAAHALGWTSLGIVRGEAPKTPSRILEACQEWGMELNYITRTAYRIESMRTDSPVNAIRIPAGGAGPPGVQGAAGILQGIDIHRYTHIIAAVGTGTMLAGLIQSAGPEQAVWGIPVLKGNDTLTPWIQTMLQDRSITCRWTLQWGYDEGGYGKSNPALIDFMIRFYKETGIPTDQIYTGKLFKTLDRWVRTGTFPDGSRILCIHSGGLWGNASLPPGTLPY